MNVYEISSIPFSKVIADLAQAFSTKHHSDCGIYSVGIPENIGQGKIIGVNFPDGLGVIQYDCRFEDDTRIEFTNSDIHPLKFLYCIRGTLDHYFTAHVQDNHVLERFKNIIVASEKGNGHALQFKAGEKVQLFSIEIDRTRFWKYIECKEHSMDKALYKTLTDTEGESSFFHEGDYSLDIAGLLKDIRSFNEPHVLQKFYYSSKASEIFVLQTLRQKNAKKNRAAYIHSNIDDVRNASELIRSDLPKYSTISAVVAQVGTPSYILQRKFKDVYGQTLNEYIMERRMDEMVHYLEHTSNSIKEIAEILGVKSPSYLSKKFKERYGISPVEYRRSKGHS